MLAWFQKIQSIWQKKVSLLGNHLFFKDKQNIFVESRKKLTLHYSLMLAVGFLFLDIVIYLGIRWAIVSEQTEYLMSTAQHIASHQSALLKKPNFLFKDRFEVSEAQDRLFFYAFDNDGKIFNSSPITYSIEPLIFNTIHNWHSVIKLRVKPIFFSSSENFMALIPYTVVRENKTEEEVRFLMTQLPIYLHGEKVGTVFVGRDVTPIYLGLQKSLRVLIFISILTFILATYVGYRMAGYTIIPLAQAYEKQHQFASDASHELRTPLAILMTTIDLLSADKTIQDEFSKQALEDARDEINKMTHIISDLLTMARSGDIISGMKMMPTNVAWIAKNVVRNLKPIAEKKQITLSIQGDDEKDLIAWGDERQLTQLFIIFLDNAIKYTPEKGSVSIIFQKPKNRRLTFIIQDTGIGISPSEHGKIFDRFYQVDRARSRDESRGNGLGLAIARNIIRLHHGSIKLKSDLGKGAMFWITLPQDKTA